MCIYSLANNTLYDNHIYKDGRAKYCGTVKMTKTERGFCLGCSIGQKNSKYAWIIKNDD